jgi:hypothetical protein
MIRNYGLPLAGLLTQAPPINPPLRRGRAARRGAA